MRRTLLSSALCLLAACGGGGSNDNSAPPETPAPPQAATPASFEVRATNLTPGQPLSPLAVAIHDTDSTLFSVGMPASDGLEVLAEGGDNSQLLEEIDSAASVSAAGPLGPGDSETLTLELENEETAGLSLSLLSMLVNTNDAITGVNAVGLSGLAVGDSLELLAPAYDAGTEANSETPGTIPGPADGGEGYNAARDDVRDVVTLHPGVVTADDGLPGSALRQVHRFDNPVIAVTVTRTQ